MSVTSATRPIELMLVEDNERLRLALGEGLRATGSVRIAHTCPSGEEAISLALVHRPDAVLMDVGLAGELNGIEAAVHLRREFPRIPVVLYSIQDDDAYFRAFRRAGILSHYAYVRKTNYLLPAMILPLLQDAMAGRSFIDPEIEARVEEVREKDAQSPLELLEPNERAVAQLLAEGLSNAQIAARLGFRDKRTVARTNGQIYAAWGLNENAADEKIARTRAAIVMREGRLITWDSRGRPWAFDTRGNRVPFEPTRG